MDEDTGLGPQVDNPGSDSADDSPKPVKVAENTNPFAAIEQKYGLPEGFLSKVRHLESSDGRDTRTSSAGAKGPFQFIDETARRYGLTNPQDTMASADAAARLAADNREYMRRHGIEPTGGMLYLAHQQGPSGAVALLTGGNVPAGSLVKPAAISGNGGNPNAPAPAFVNKWLSAYEGAPVNAGLPPTPAQNVASRPVGTPQDVGVLPFSTAQAAQAQTAPPGIVGGNGVDNSQLMKWLLAQNHNPGPVQLQAMAPQQAPPLILPQALPQLANLLRRGAAFSG